MYTRFKDADVTIRSYGFEPMPKLRIGSSDEFYYKSKNDSEGSLLHVIVDRNPYHLDLVITDLVLVNVWFKQSQATFNYRCYINSVLRTHDASGFLFGSITTTDYSKITKIENLEDIVYFL